MDESNQAPVTDSAPSTGSAEAAATGGQAAPAGQQATEQQARQTLPVQSSQHQRTKAKAEGKKEVKKAQRLPLITTSPFPKGIRPMMRRW